MGRILHIEPARRGGAARGLAVATAMLLAAAVGVGLTHLGDETAPASLGAAPRPNATAPETKPAQRDRTAVATTEPPSPAMALCPLQSLRLSLGRAPAHTVCMDATVLQQSGSVRSLVVRAADAEGWALRVDVVERSVRSVVLEARDGRSFGCEAPGCPVAAAIVSQRTGGPGTLALSDLRLVRTMPTGGQAGSVPNEVIVNARLRVPTDEQVPGLACSGPSATLQAADGSLRRFCGQGGAGVEIGDDGHRHYRFNDHEGRTLAIAVDTEQRVVGVAWEGQSCRADGCRGVRTSTADPSNDLAERTFYFGRTALFDQTAAGETTGTPRPALVIDGTLVMPAQ